MGETCSSDLEQFDTNKAAIKHGFEITGSDDFNIGRIVDGRLVEFLWMKKPLKTSDIELHEIADDIGLRPHVAATAAAAPEVGTDG